MRSIQLITSNYLKESEPIEKLQDYSIFLIKNWNSSGTSKTNIKKIVQKQLKKLAYKFNSAKLLLKPQLQTEKSQTKYGCLAQEVWSECEGKNLTYIQPKVTNNANHNGYKNRFKNRVLKTKSNRGRRKSGNVESNNQVQILFPQYGLEHAWFQKQCSIFRPFDCRTSDADLLSNKSENLEESMNLQQATQSAQQYNDYNGLFGTSEGIDLFVP